jgi:hypothetical protein
MGHGAELVRAGLIAAVTGFVHPGLFDRFGLPLHG